MKKAGAAALAAAIVTLFVLVPFAVCSADTGKAAGGMIRSDTGWDTDGDGVFEILAIGNSFSVDALQYVWQIASSLGIERIAVGNLVIGGCSIAMHAENARNDLGKYTYYFNDSGSWTRTDDYRISTALAERSWDFVSMQQQSGVSGMASAYDSDLTYLISYVKERASARLAWHMTWAYQQDSSHAAFANYSNDQIAMYSAIASAVRQKIGRNKNIDVIIPSGTAVQNARTSLIGDTLTRDGYHLSKGLGRYLTGLMVVKSLTGMDISHIGYAPSGVGDLYRSIAAEAVNNAYDEPFAITGSLYKDPDACEDYVLLRPKLFKGQYWDPSNAKYYDELLTDAAGGVRCFSSVRFTRQELPAGSIILLETGWKYRPNGWTSGQTGCSERAPVSKASYVLVTDEWWGSYALRAFNVTYADGRTATDISEEDMRGAVRIYVPKESHIHDCENGACALCGKAVGPVFVTQADRGGYSRAFKLVCDELRIPCILSDVSAGEDVMRSRVKLGDEWYSAVVILDGSSPYGSVSGDGGRARFRVSAVSGNAYGDLVIRFSMGPASAGAIGETARFTDVDDGAYYADAVRWAVVNGVTDGTGWDKAGDPIFSPAATVTRGQAVTFLWRAMGKPDPAAAGRSFADVPENAYYSRAVSWAVENGITNGTGWDSKKTPVFSPNAPVTRGQMLTFLWRTLGMPGNSLDPLWYADAERWAERNAIADGTAQTYATGADCPRCDVVLYLYRAVPTMAG